MKLRPINFKAHEVRAIREGRKTQKRLIIKPQPLALYRLTGDRIECIHRDDENIDRCYFEANSSLTKLGLYGGKRWSDLFENQICRLWAEGARGLVSAKRSQQRKGIPIRFHVSREPEGNQIGSQTGLHCVSRVSTVKNTPSSPFGWRKIQQHSSESSVGDARGELGGSSSSWSRNGGGETSRIQTDRRREIITALGNLKGPVQPKDGCSMPWDVSVGNLGDCEWQVGTRIWVRETWGMSFEDIVPAGRQFASGGTWGSPARLNRKPCVVFRADGDMLDDSPSETATWCPPVIMPHWASRITLEIVSVRVERLNAIDADDAESEGCGCGVNDETGGPVARYKTLWESINGPGSWDLNPWVWVVEFKEVK